MISYTNWVKHNLLGVDQHLLDTLGAVSAPVAEAMAKGAREAIQADIAVSVTGLAGPGGDEFGNPVGSSATATLGRPFPAAFSSPAAGKKSGRPPAGRP